MMHIQQRHLTKKKAHPRPSLKVPPSHRLPPEPARPVNIIRKKINLSVDSFPIIRRSHLDLRDRCGGWRCGDPRRLPAELELSDTSKSAKHPGRELHKSNCCEQLLSILE